MSTASHEDDILPFDEAAWDADDIELAYQQALQAVEAAEDRVDFELLAAPNDEPCESPPADGAAACESAAPPACDESAAGLPELPGVTPRQIIEAALFVGGTPLTIKRLCSLLRDEFDHNFVEETIDGLNAQYADEQRPYEITFGEGGYRLSLRSEYERLRDKTYGYGPREVKLSQDALEVLALVAYRQPVSGRQIEELGKKSPGSVLRQLVRRELIAIERGEESGQEVAYRTTPRFLELFGLKDLDELPQSDDDLNYK